MYYPYVTVDNDIEVVHTPWNGNNTSVRIEIPDEEYCFKVIECTIPGYEVKEIIGLSKQEVDRWLEFLRQNSGLLINMSKCGGIQNAEFTQVYGL